METTLRNNIQTKYKLFRLGLFLLFLNSMYPWPMWFWKIPYVPIFACLSAIPIILNKKYYFANNRGKHAYLFVFVLFLLWSFRSLSFFGIVGQIISIVPIICVLSLKTQYMVDIIRFITKWFALLLGVSLFVYILYMVGVPLPHQDYNFGEYYTHDNYYFFVTFSLSYRFSSIFLEPGHLTMGLAPLLFINRYNLKDKYVLVLFISQLFSLSLAGIVIMFVGLLMQAFLSKNIMTGVAKLLLVVSIIFIAGYGLVKLTGMDDLIQVAIVDRVISGEDAMDKRTDSFTESQFNRLVQSDDIWMGKPELADKVEGAGYKVYLLIYGLIGCLLTAILYFIPVLANKKLDVLFFYLLLMMLFVQDSYPAWSCALICSIAGSVYLSETSVINRKKVVYG